jgi:hypothetical protein
MMAEFDVEVKSGVEVPLFSHLKTNGSATIRATQWIINGCCDYSRKSARTKSRHSVRERQTCIVLLFRG